MLADTTGVAPNIITTVTDNLKTITIPDVNMTDISNNINENIEIINIILGALVTSGVIVSSISNPIIPLAILAGFAISLISTIIIEGRQTRQQEITEIYNLMLSMLMMLLKINYLIVEFDIIKSSDTDNVTILINIIIEKCIMLIVKIKKLGDVISTMRKIQSALGFPVIITTEIYNQLTIINSMYIQILTELELNLMNQYFEILV